MIMKTTAKYYTTYKANGGSTYSTQPYEYTNKKKAVADIRRIVKGNHYQQKGNVSSYAVTDEDGVTVAAGELHGDTMWWTRTI